MGLGVNIFGGPTPVKSGYNEIYYWPMQILYLFQFYILIYYKNIGTKSYIFQYIYIDNHRWQFLRSIVKESSIKINILKKVPCYVIIGCKS